MTPLRIPLLLAAALLSTAGAAAGAVAPAAKPVAPRPAKPLPAKPAKPVGPLTLVMRGLDKITGKPVTLLVPIGKSVQFATLTVYDRY